MNGLHWRVRVDSMNGHFSDLNQSSVWWVLRLLFSVTENLSDKSKCKSNSFILCAEKSNLLQTCFDSNPSIIDTNVFAYPIKCWVRFCVWFNVTRSIMMNHPTSSLYLSTLPIPTSLTHNVGLPVGRLVGLAFWAHIIYITPFFWKEI